METTQQTPTPEMETRKPTGTLLGTISYENREDYDNFLNSLTLEHAAIVLISAANFAQGKGIFSLDEAALISNAIKRLTTKPDQEPAPEEVTELHTEDSN